jgi:hypothetical protein
LAFEYITRRGLSLESDLPKFRLKAGDGIFQTEVDPAQDLSMAFHAVLVIGFGERDGNKYWLIRNSYGVQWGYEGYGLIERDCGNLRGRCCIARFPVYPIWEVWNQFFCFHNFLKCLVYPLYLL